MPPPARRTLKRVTATFTDAVGTAAAGTVTFTPSTTLVDRATNTIIMPTPVTVALVAGRLAVDLPATDDPTMVAGGSAFYTVAEAVAGSAPRVYNMALPAATPGPVDLSDVVPLALAPTPNLTLLALAALGDVDLTGLGDGDVLTYRAGTGTWTPTPRR